LKCVIIAAGRGSRLAARAASKPLYPVNGRPLIEWVIGAAARAGLKDFLVVTGHARDRLERYLERLSHGKDISISCVFNEEWEKENGLSVSKARGLAGDTFVLSMSDHIFDPGILVRLVAQPIASDEVILAVDYEVRNNPWVDAEDVTRVLAEDGNIVGVGKGLEAYNAFDTGIFLCTSAIFRALEESRKNGDSTLTGGIRVLAKKGKARVMDIDGGFWLDVDDEKAVERADKLLALKR